MRVSSFAEIEPEFVERAHRMVWCDMATVGPDGRPRTRIVHPVWEGDTAWMTSLRLGPKAEDIDRNQSCRQKHSHIPPGCGRHRARGTIIMRGRLNGATMTHEQAPESHADLPEPAPETLTLDQLLRAGLGRL